MSDHAELMTLRICQRLPFDAIGRNRRTNPSRPERLQMVDVGHRIVRMHVEMHAVLTDLRLWNRLQDQDRSRWLILKRRKDSVAIGGVDQSISERRLPEGHQSIGIATVKYDRNSHDATLRPPTRRCQAPVSRASRSASVSRRISDTVRSIV